MPKVSPLQSNFVSGEFSPLLFGRVDADRYKTGLAVCLNYIPTIQGSLPRRPGTIFVAETKFSSKKSRILKFEFSTTQAYMLEFGDAYIRFFKNNAAITLPDVVITNATRANPCVVTANAHGYANGDRVLINDVVGMVQLNNREFQVANVTANTFELKDAQTLVNLDSTFYTAYASSGVVAKIYEIVSPYLEADLRKIKFTQSADVIYLAHPNYPTRKLTRTAHTSWTITAIDFKDGPYLNLTTYNDGSISTITLTPSSGAVGAGNVTASAAFFVATDVGRLIRIKQGANPWGYCKITAFTSTTQVDVTFVNATAGTAATLNWKLGVWSATTGYPTCVVFHEDRLGGAGPSSFPQRMDLSEVSEYESFAPTELDANGTITASNALSFTFNANDVNAVRWLTSDEKGLLAGTLSAEWVVKPSSQSEALSQTNVNAKKATSYGSADIQPVQIGNATVYIQRASRKARELTYFYEVDGFRSPDLTELSEHIAESGIVEIAHQKEPQSIMWAVRNDGVVATMVYDRDPQTLRVGWSRNILGGVSDAAGSDTIAESVSTIPTADGTAEEPWFIAKRYINGAIHRYIEYGSKFFNDEDSQSDAFFVDCGLTYDDPKTITGATKANPVVITSVLHGFSNGDTAIISDVLGMTQLNNNIYKISNVTANTFELQNSDGDNIDGTAFTTYVSGGFVRKRVTHISGLFHLEGQSIRVLGDGAVQPSVTVTNGAVTLSTAAGKVHLGFGYNSDAQMLRLEAGAADGTALGKTRRTHRVGFLVHRTLGMKIGFSFTELSELTFRTGSDLMGHPPELFTGIKSEEINSGYDFENQFCWRQDQPLPGIIQAVMPQMVTQDRG